MSDVSARLGELINEVANVPELTTRDALVLLVYKIETDPALRVLPVEE